MDTMSSIATEEPASAVPPERTDGPAGGNGPDAPTRLRRSRTRRMLAGVARGLSDRYGVDVSLVRVAFVVLACAWGLGLIIYAAMWALVPRERAGTAPGTDADADAEPTEPWLAYALLAGVLAFGLLVVSSWWGGPRWGGGVGLLWLVLLFGLLAVAIAAPASRFRLRRILGVALLGAMSLVILAVGGFLALVAWTGVPIAGGIGDRVVVPMSVAQMRPTYRLAAGDLDVDLRRIAFPRSGSPMRLTVSVAVGRVTVEVPSSLDVAINANAGVGDVVSSTGSVSSFGAPTAGRAAGAPQLFLTVDAGVGQVRLVRGVPL